MLQFILFITSILYILIDVTCFKKLTLLFLFFIFLSEWTNYLKHIICLRWNKYNKWAKKLTLISFNGQRQSLKSHWYQDFGGEFSTRRKKWRNWSKKVAIRKDKGMDHTLEEKTLGFVCTPPRPSHSAYE